MNFIPTAGHGEIGLWFWMITIPLAVIYICIIIKQETRKGKS